HPPPQSPLFPYTTLFRSMALRLTTGYWSAIASGDSPSRNAPITVSSVTHVPATRMTPCSSTRNGGVSAVITGAALGVTASDMPVICIRGSDSARPNRVGEQARHHTGGDALPD